MSEPLIRLQDVSKYYASKDAVALGLRKVNAEFMKGEFVAITGESGSGKSTLLNVLSGIDTYEEGEMFFDGQETSPFTGADWDEYRRKNIAFVFQDYSLIDSYTVLQNVELSLFDNFPDAKARRERALDLLKKVDLYSHRRHKCTKLSGGQKQRVAIARALAKDAPIILADEPTGNLDSETSKSIIKLMAETAKDKLLIVVTHDYSDVQSYATRKIRMYDGGIAEDKTITKPSEIKDNKDIKAIGEGEDTKKFIKASVKIATNNLLATPKRSIFILSTSFIAVFLVAIFLFTYINNIIPPSGQNSMGDRRDTLFVIEKDRNDLSSEDIATISAINGVEAALHNYAAFNMYFTPKQMYWDDVRFMFELNMKILTTANFPRKTPAHGTVPKNDNEILLGWSNKGKPDLTLIGKEIEVVFMESGGWYDESMNPEEQGYIVKKYILSGYDTNGFCYLTPNALEALSTEYYNKSSTSIDMYFPSYKDSHGNDIDYYNGIWSRNISLYESDEINHDYIYLVYDPSYNTINNNSDLSAAIYAFSNLNAQSISAQAYGKSGVVYYQIYPATPSINEEIFEEFSSDDKKPLLVISSSNNAFKVVQSKSTAMVIIGQDKKADNVIDALNSAGYKVVYPYSRPLEVYDIIQRLTSQIFGLVLGLIIAIIATGLISEVYSRISKSKKKDYNILRTVGLSNKIIKSINYAEFIIINTVAFVLMFLTFIGIALVSRIAGNASLTNAINSLLPYGALHFQSFMVYLGVFALLMVMTLMIANKFNRKMFKVSVKKSLTETV